MKKFTILNVLGKSSMTPVLGKSAKIATENVNDPEQAIEKLNLFSVNVILIDKSNEPIDVEKLTKIGQFLHPEVRIFVYDFQDNKGYERLVGNLWEEDFKRRMAKYNIEDHAMLN